MRKLFFSSIALLSLTVFTASAQQPAMALQKGQKYAVETTIKASSSAEVMGQTMENNADSKTTTTYEVMETSDGGATLNSTMVKLKVTVSAMGQEMGFDSDKNDNSGPMADVLEGSINKPRKVVIDTKGNISSQDEEDMAAKAAIMGMGGAAAPAKTTEMYIPVLMGKELKTGDKIDFSDASKTEKSDSKETGTYVVGAIENGIANVSYSGTMQLNTVMEQMGMEMNMTSTNTIKTELQMEIKTGLVLVKASVVDATVSVDAGGMTIPATAKTTTTVKISQAN